MAVAEYQHVIEGLLALASLSRYSPLSLFDQAWVTPSKGPR